MVSVIGPFGAVGPVTGSMRNPREDLAISLFQFRRLWRAEFLATPASLGLKAVEGSHPPRRFAILRRVRKPSGLAFLRFGGGDFLPRRSTPNVQALSADGAEESAVV